MEWSTNHPRWLRLRKLVLAGEPVCRQCRDELAVDVHHEVDRKDSPALTWVVSNLVPLCKGCHSTITGKREAARRAALRASVRCRATI